jgi:hypothetical protein
MQLCPWCGTGILDADPVSSHNGHIWHTDCVTTLDEATDALIAARIRSSRTATTGHACGGAGGGARADPKVHRGGSRARSSQP